MSYHPELVADGVQAVQQPALARPAPWQHGQRGADVGPDSGQVVEGDLFQAGLPGHADRGQRGSRHPIDPLSHPAHRVGGLGDPGDLVGMHPGLGGVMGTLGLRHQKLDVGTQDPDGEAPRQERPRIELVRSTFS